MKVMSKPLGRNDWYNPLTWLWLSVLLCVLRLGVGSATLLSLPTLELPYQPAPCYHKELDDWTFLEGKWTVHVSARLAANGPWEETEASAEIKRDLNGCLLSERFTGTRQGRPFQALSLFAWNDNSKTLQQVFSDSEHGPLVFYQGRKNGAEILVDLDWKLPDGRIVTCSADRSDAYWGCAGS